MDLLLKNVQIFDGKSSEPFIADIGIIDDFISRIGQLNCADAAKTLDCHGLLAAPGFIDLCSSSMTSILQNPQQISKLSQGISMEIIGLNGQSNFPVNETTSELHHKQDSMVTGWADAESYLQRVKRLRPSINTGVLTGYQTLEKHFSLEKSVFPSPRKIEDMGLLLSETLKQGSLGLSVDLSRFPETDFPWGALHQMTEILDPALHFVACQLPRNGANLLTALAEILTIQKKTKIPLLLTNLGVEGKNSTTIQELLVETITEARSLGYSIHGSSTFFPLRSTTLVDFLPDWSTKDGIPTLVKRLQDPLIRGKISQHLQHYQSQDRNFFQNLKISALPNPMDQDNIGMDLEAAFMTTKERRDFFQYLLKLLERNQFDVKLLCFQRNEQLINFLHKQDWIIPATSSPSLNLPGDQTDSLIHPATFSTFPQFLKFVQQTEPERLFLRWKKYLEIVSSLLKIENRGKIAPGFYADLTLFDAKKLAVKNSWKTPWLTHPAISTVLVNGRVCWQNGKVHDSKKGQIIRSQFVKM